MEADRENSARLDRSAGRRPLGSRGSPHPRRSVGDCPQLLTRFRREVASREQVDWLNDSFQTGTSASVSASGSARDTGDELSLPRVLAERYRLDVLVGRGGFGRVYQGFDTRLERAVALKIPRSNRPAVLETWISAGSRHVKWPSAPPEHRPGPRRRPRGSSCFIVGEWIEGEPGTPDQERAACS